jgi:hypothetical protein
MRKGGQTMTTRKRKGAAPDQENAPSKVQPAQSTKKSIILAILRGGNSLNRFEAERFGDHTLNSTISELRNEGHLFHDYWESVPTRFGREVRVKRYAYLSAPDLPRLTVKKGGKD